MLKVKQFMLEDIVRYYANPEEINQKLRDYQQMYRFNVRKFFQLTNLLDRKGNPTPLYMKLHELLNTRPNNYINASLSEQIFMEIVWIELLSNEESKGNFYRYIKIFPEHSEKKKLIELLEERGLSKNSATKYVNNILFTLNNTNWGTWFFKIEKVGKQVYIQRKEFYDGELEHLSIFGLAYALYRIVKEKEKWNGTSLREIVSPKTEIAQVLNLYLFPTYHLRKMLRGLKNRKMIGLELVADLDNIHLLPNMNSLKVIDKAIELIKNNF
jgi:hypothetical protein